MVVTEGFAGNIALKTAEGTAKQISAYLHQALRSSLASKLGYLLARRAFSALATKMDPRRVNGGIFLGLDGVVIKSHGGSDAIGTARALEIGYEMVRRPTFEQEFAITPLSGRAGIQPPQSQASCGVRSEAPDRAAPRNAQASPN